MRIRENTAHHQFLTEFVVQRGVRELFWEDSGVLASYGLRRAVHQPRTIPGSPVIQGFRSGGTEYGFRTMLCSLIQLPDSERYRMYYSVHPPPERERWGLNGRRVPCAVDRGEPISTVILLACAESDDGVHWQEPSLGQMEFEGSADNNLIDECDGVADYIAQSQSVYYDARTEDAAQRFKLYHWARRSPDEMHMEVSADGLTFRPAADNPVWQHGAYDSYLAPMWDEDRQEYLSFGRAYGRATGVRTSKDLVNWSDPQPAIRFVDRRKQDYTTSVHRYEGLYVGFVNTFYLEWKGSMASLDITLAASRDGFNWQHVDELQPFVARSPEGQHIRTPVGLIRRGDDLLVYWSSSPYWHGPVANEDPDEIHASSVIRVATLKVDRFVSWTGDDVPGHLLTMPFRLPAGELYINTAATEGYVEVRLLDVLGNAIPGLGAVRLTLDSTRAKVELPLAKLASLEGQPVQLRFDLQCARLFSYWFK